MVNKKKKAYYLRLKDSIDEKSWNMELRVIVLKEIREGIRKQFEETSGKVKAFEEEIAKESNPAKRELYISEKKKYEKDAEKMKEQMLGKWIEVEVRYDGGLDQEIKAIQEKIKGGEEFKGVIDKALKRI